MTPLSNEAAQAAETIRAVRANGQTRCTCGGTACPTCSIA